MLVAIKGVVVSVALLVLVSPALAAGPSMAEAKAAITAKFQSIDPATELLWKGLNVGAPQAPTMYDKVQLHVPANAEVYLVRAAFTTKWGSGPLFNEKHYVSFYEFFSDDQGGWQAEQTATDGTYESDPYYAK